MGLNNVPVCFVVGEEEMGNALTLFYSADFGTKYLPFFQFVKDLQSINSIEHHDMSVSGDLTCFSDIANR